MCSAEPSKGSVVSPDADQRLRAVRAAEEALAAIRTNNSAAIARILDDQFIYINARGMIYDKESYLGAVRSRALTYSPDMELTETDVRRRHHRWSDARARSDRAGAGRLSPQEHACVAEAPG